MPSTKLVALLGALALISGCNKERAPALASTAGTTAACNDELPPDTVVATWGDGKKLTAGEVDKEIAGQLASANYEARERKYETRRGYVQNKLMEEVFKDEAQKRGVTEEQLLKTEVADKVTTASDAAIDGWLNMLKRQGQIPPQVTVEIVRQQAEQNPQILDQPLQFERQRALQAYYDKLAKERGVQVKLSPPRLAVDAKGPSKGPENAPITIVEFSDFQCPYCGVATAELKKVEEKNPGKVRVVFRHFPLDFHENAQKAGEASMCAQDQGKFWEMHDVLFANQKALQVDQLKKYAADLKLDTAKFDECLDSGRHAAVVKSDMDAGQKLGVSGTPAFLINGIFKGGALQAEQFQQVIDEELARQQK